MCDQEELEEDSFVATFRLADEHFALDTADLHEMVRLGDLTRIATAPPYLMGIMNLRGKMVNIIDLGAKLEMDSCLPGEETRVMIVSYESCLVGLCVDGLEDIFPLSSADERPPPSHLVGMRQKCIQKILIHNQQKYALVQLQSLLDPL